MHFKLYKVWKISIKKIKFVKNNIAREGGMKLKRERKEVVMRVKRKKEWKKEKKKKEITVRFKDLHK